MGFSGGGSNVLPPHTHDGTIAQDGGSLNMDNITQGNLTSGDTVYSDGVHMQRLGIGGAGTALLSDGLLPSWGAAAGGSMTFLETFTNPSESDFFSCELASDFVYNDNEWLVVSLNATMTATASYPNQLGIGYQVADTGTTFLSSDNFSTGQIIINPAYLGYGGYFLAAKASSLILPDSVTTGSGYTGLSTDQVFNSTMWFGQNSQTVGSLKFMPMYYQTFAGAGGVYCQGVGYHEHTTLPTTLSAIRFFATQGSSYTEESNGMGIDATCSLWKVIR